MRRLSPEDEDRIAQLDAFATLTKRDQWRDLLAREPRLAQIKAEADHLSGKERAVRVSALLGPNSGSSDLILSSPQALFAAHRWLRRALVACLGGAPVRPLGARGGLISRRVFRCRDSSHRLSAVRADSAHDGDEHRSEHS